MTSSSALHIPTSTDVAYSRKQYARNVYTVSGKSTKAQKAICAAMGLCLCTSMVIGAQAFTPAYAYAASSTSRSAQDKLEIAPHTSVEGQGEDTSNKGTWKGTWKASVPIAELMRTQESKMKTAASAGLYPHGKDGAHTIAYVGYDVSFPKGVTPASEDTITVANTTTMFNTNAFEKKVDTDKRQVSFKFKLCDENWSAIYDKWKNDVKKDPKATIDITIPYTVKAKDEAEALSLAKNKITAEGDFETHASGSMYAWTKHVTKTDKSEAPVLLVADARTTGIASQNAPIEAHNDALKLPGDLLIENDSATSKPFEKPCGIPVTVTGNLHVKPVKDQMNEVIKKYQNANLKDADIVIQKCASSFEAELKLPVDMKFMTMGDTHADDDTHKTVNGVLVELVGANGKYKISEATITNNTLHVKMTLAKDNVSNFSDIKDAVLGMGDDLKLTVKGMQLNGSAQKDKVYKIEGVMGGLLEATAISKSSGRTISFDLRYQAEQSDDGMDSLATEEEKAAKKIIASLKCIKKSGSSIIPPTPPAPDPTPVPQPTPAPTPAPQPSPTPTPEDTPVPAPAPEVTPAPQQPKETPHHQSTRKKHTIPQTGDIFGGASLLTALGVVLAAVGRTKRK